jgi:putative hydrolase of the HAD superfamily
MHADPAASDRAVSAIGVARILGVVEAALIDLFDTLVWSEWRALRSSMARELGVPEDVLIRAYETTYTPRQTGAFGSAEGDIAALVEACGLEPEPAFVRRITGLVASHLDGRVHLYDDALPTLRELRARGVRTAVVSNCDHFAGPLVRELGLRDEVDALVLSFEVGSHKPDARIYEVALEALGASPERAVFVDDQPWYLDGAAALGIATRYIRRAREPWEGHRDPGPHPTISSLAELLGA